VREILKDQNGSVYGIGAMTIEVPLQKHAPTFYNRHGDRFGWGCVAVTIILLFAKFKVRK
jgi:hypothetical protein